jgi:hypothetical protein
MSQQLNLLPQAKARYSPAAVALMILGCVMAGLFFTWGVKRSLLATAKDGEAASAAELKTVTAQLEQRFRARAAELNAQIDGLKLRATEAQQVINLAAGVGKPEGYSFYFSSLAATREDGVWLNDVAVGQAGKSMQLGGLSLDKDAVLRYSQRLNAVFADSGIKLTNLEMTSQPLGAPGAPGTTGTVGADGAIAVPLTAIKFSLR